MVLVTLLQWHILMLNKKSKEKVTLNKTNYKLFWIWWETNGSVKKVAQISKKGYDFLFGRIYVTGDDVCQNVLVFSPVFNLVTLDISTGISVEKIKLFGSSLILVLSNLSQGIIILKFNNSILVQQSSSSFYRNFLKILYITYESNDWSENPSNDFTMKRVYLVKSN